LAPVSLWLFGAAPRGALHRSSALGRRPGDGRPNLILITIDALRPDRLGAYGNPRGLTPNLDAFATEATRYQAAYAPSSWTLASLSALFTGLPPSSSGLMGLSSSYPRRSPYYGRLPENRVLLSERLQRAGYATAADVTNVFLESNLGWRRGFDDFRNEGGVDGDLAVFAHAQTLTEHSSHWLRLNWHQPFFLWIHYLDPHCPYDSPDTPKALRARYPAGWVGRRDYWNSRMAHAPADTRALYQQFCREMYDQEVRYVDHWVGRLLAELKAAGLYEHSLIVITADHGEELFDHGGIDHGHSMHEEVLRVPLLVKWPAGVAADARVTQVVASADVGGTLLEMAQAPGLNGREAALPRREGASRSSVYSEGVLYGPEQTVLTTDTYRVIYHPYGRPTEARFEVYDRQNDPREHHNLAGTGAASDLRYRLKRLTEVADAEAEATGGGSPGYRPSKDEEHRLRSLGYLGK
jgi:arylsulfatase A-like enzyme